MYVTVVSFIPFLSYGNRFIWGRLKLIVGSIIDELEVPGGNEKIVTRLGFCRTVRILIEGFFGGPSKDHLFSIDFVVYSSSNHTFILLSAALDSDE
jgi:hypothetical protein